MSGNATRKLISGFMQKAPVSDALTSLCQTPAENYYNGEFLEQDYWGDKEDIAPVVTDLQNGNNKFSIEEFVNKEFKAPVMLDEFSIDTFKLIKRQYDQTPFENPQYMANLAKLWQTHMVIGAERQRRTVELMVAQMLQTGKIILKDSKGEPAYEIDFQQKASHLPTFATAWTDSANATPFKDLENMGDVIVTDGKRQPRRVIMSQASYYNMIRTEEYLNLADNRRVFIVNNTSAPVIEGMMYKGTLDLTAYTLDLYVYTGEYVDIDGTTKRFITSGSVIMMPETVRLDLTFGGIPLVVAPDPRVGFLSTRARVQSMKLDITTNAWVSEDGRFVKGFVGSRPLPILTAKNQIMCGQSGS